MLEAATDQLIDCGDGVVLKGEYSHHPRQRGLVILLHGWLGSSQSLYLLSAGSALFAEGYSIFRLNLRDHGDTHSLNRELFHSARLQEVIHAVGEICRQFRHRHHFLVGFSLGGNFALRVARHSAETGIQLDKVVAICPVVSPGNTNDNLSRSLLYQRYFVKRWRDSLLKKLRHFPELGFHRELRSLRKLNQMNDFFVPRYTPYAKVQDYLKAYAIDGNYLQSLKVPCTIIASQDDPIIEYRDFSLLAKNPLIELEITQLGGHCGYIKNARLESWIDDRLIALLNRVSSAGSNKQSINASI